MTRLLGLSLVLLLSDPSWAADTSCRTDAFGVRRCSDGTRYRTDAYGTMRDSSGKRSRHDAGGATERTDPGSNWATRDGKPWGGLDPDENRRDRDGKPCDRKALDADKCGK